MKGLKTYFTFLNRNKLFTFVNLVGLSISLMFVLLIANMVTRQLTVDRNLKDADRIWVYSNEYYAGGHYRLGTLFQERYPEIEDWCAVNSYQRFVVEADNRQVNGNIAVVRKNFFRFFTLPLVSGNRGEVMRGDNDVVLSRSFALKLFGTTDCLGKVLRCSFNEQDYRVSGVMDDIDNSIFPSEWDVLVPFENMKYINDASDMDDTTMGNAGSCILFMRTVKHADLNDKAADVAAYLKTVFWPYQHGSLKEAHFIPIHDFYFSETNSIMQLNQYSFKKVVIFLTVGILILLMAVFNYVSMSVAQTSYRAKEMATRRLLGSTRRDIFWRMILESVLLTAFAFVLGFLFAKAAEPYAMKLLGVRLDIVGSLSGLTLPVYIVTILLLSFLSGFFPATLLSNYNPMDVVKGTFRRKTKALYLRLLNIFQNGLTIAMLGCSLYLCVQLYRILHEPLGYEYGQIVVYPPLAEKSRLDLFRGEALKLPFVKRVSFCMGTPNNGGNNNTTYFNVGDTVKEMSFQTLVVDSAFVEMFHIRITEDRRLPDRKGVFVSESAMRELQSIGQGGDYYADRYGSQVRIAGQFKDFKIRSVLDEQHPLQMQIRPCEDIYPWTILVEVEEAEPEQYRRQLDALYSDILNGLPFESTWYHQDMQKQYDDIMRLNNTLLVFTCTALLISLLGLTAMSIYFITQRKRDIAIRKVFGSSSRGEQLLLIRFSLRSLLVSLVPALPLMYAGIVQIDKLVPFGGAFPWWVPLLALAFVLLVSLGSVWLISLKATRENPVNHLKTE